MPTETEDDDEVPEMNSSFTGQQRDDLFCVSVWHMGEGMSDASLLLSSSFAITIQGGRGKERHLAVVEGFVCVQKHQDGLFLSYLLIWQLCSTKFHTLYQSIGWVAFCGVLRRTFVYEIDCRVIYLLVVERYWRLRSDQKWTALITGVNCFVMQFYYSKDQC